MENPPLFKAIDEANVNARTRIKVLAATRSFHFYSRPIRNLTNYYSLICLIIVNQSDSDILVLQLFPAGGETLFPLDEVSGFNIMLNLL